MDNSESTTKQTKGKIGMKVYKHIFHLTHWSELVKGNHNSMPYPIPDLREHNQMGVERKKHNHCHQHLQTVGFFLLYREYQETHTKTFNCCGLGGFHHVETFEHEIHSLVLIPIRSHGATH